jgi:hypothetical protein
MLANSTIGVTKFRKEEYLAFLNKYDAHFDEKHLWDELRPIRPYPNGTVLSRDLFPGTSCQATIAQSLRDSSQ